jgi:hypothetical protein
MISRFAVLVGKESGGEGEGGVNLYRIATSVDDGAGSISEAL